MQLLTDYKTVQFRKIDKYLTDKDDYNDHDNDRDENGLGGATFTLMNGISTSDPVAGFEIPPDNGLAVDAGYIVSGANSAVKWTNINGGHAVEKSMTLFFAPLGNYNYFIDARVIYNKSAGKFVVSSSTSDTAGNYHFLVGISKDLNPNDGFAFRDFQYANKTSLIDQPDVAADGSTLFLLGSLYDTAGNNTQHLLVNNGLGLNKEIDLGAGGVYKEVGSLHKGDYLLAQSGGNLTLKHVSSAGVLDGSSSVSLGNISSKYNEMALATKGTSQPIDAGDARVYGLALNNNTMWATFEVTPTTGPDAGTANAHWVELNVADPSHIAVIDQGTISGSKLGVGVGTATSSIAVDGAGDTLINFIASGPGMTPTDYFAIKLAGATSFSDLIPYASSAGTFFQAGATDFGGIVSSRFGDYSSAVADPNNPHGFYISNEVGTTPGSWQWATTLAHVIVPSQDIA